MEVQASGKSTALTGQEGRSAQGSHAGGDVQVGIGKNQLAAGNTVVVKPPEIVHGDRLADPPAAPGDQRCPLGRS